MSLNRREKILLMAVVYSAIFCLGWFGLVDPVLRQQEALQHELQLINSQLRELLPETMEAASANVMPPERIDLLLPQQHQAVALLSAIGIMIENSGCTLAELTLENPDSNRNAAAPELALKLELHGTVDQAASLLQALENSERLLSVNSLELYRDNSPTNHDWNFILMVSAWYGQTELVAEI